jgi:glycosyltransferase involved in cell wall biosynthesis
VSAIPIAFYAPLKRPDHPTPSGDRSVARLLLQALERGGFAPILASRLRTFEPAGDEGRQRAIAEESRGEAERVIERFARAPEAERPRLWFTYHSYYKAPDHLGPLVAERLGIPYAVAEASWAAKRHVGPWRYAHAALEAGLATASAIFVSTPHDRAALARDFGPGRLVDLPPFLDLAPWGEHASGAVRSAGGPVRLLAVAMMRPGDKLASFRILAEALALARGDWTLTVAGDGPARPEVEALFAPFRDRVRLLGDVRERRALARLYAESELLVWPAVNEAYGMALLEAQALGCPVLAGGSPGVASVVRPGETGVLSRPGDAAAFAADLASLLGEPGLRRHLGEAARRFVAEERDLPGAAAILRRALTADLAAACVPA